jgi:spore coat polysaccharide biosynthesis protein SpsF
LTIVAIRRDNELLLFMTAGGKIESELSQTKTAAIVETRMRSTRLPGKALLPAAGKSLLEHLIERLRRARHLEEIIIATTVNDADDRIAQLANDLGVNFFRGSEEDVLGRVLAAARASNVDVIVEIPSDRPLIDPRIVEPCVEGFFATGADYVANNLERSYPLGMDTQVFATDTLEEVARQTLDPVDREHVSLYIYSHPEKYRLLNVKAPPEHTRPWLRLTVDTEEDYHVVRAIFEGLYPLKKDFDLGDILAFLDEHPNIAAINAKVKQKPVGP